MTGKKEGRDRGEGDLEKRVRKVLHLDPFRMSRRPDGRFYCELETPPDELTPEEARRILRAMEPLLDALRRRAGEA